MDDAHDASLRTLRAASVFARGGEGFVQRLSAEAIAYQAIRSDAARLRGELDDLVRTGSAAGALYAAVLIASVDGDVGRAAWTALLARGDDVIVHPGGCTPRFHTTVSEVARAMLDDPEGAIEACFRRWLARLDAADRDR